MARTSCQRVARGGRVDLHATLRAQSWLRLHRRRWSAAMTRAAGARIGRPVTYLKCALVGIATGTVLAILWVAGCLFLPLLFLKNRALGASSVGSDSTMLVWLVGFTIGFWFARRR